MVINMVIDMFSLFQNLNFAAAVVVVVVVVIESSILSQCIGKAPPITLWL